MYRSFIDHRGFLVEISEMKCTSRKLTINVYEAVLIYY